MPDLGQKTRGCGCFVFFYPALELMLTDPNLLSSRSLEKATTVQSLTQSLKPFVSFFIHLYLSLFCLDSISWSLSFSADLCLSLFSFCPCLCLLSFCLCMSFCLSISAFFFFLTFLLSLSFSLFFLFISSSLSVFMYPCFCLSLTPLNILSYTVSDIFFCYSLVCMRLYIILCFKIHYDKIWVLGLALEKVTKMTFILSNVQEYLHFPGLEKKNSSQGPNEILEFCDFVLFCSCWVSSTIPQLIINFEFSL